MLPKVMGAPSGTLEFCELGRRGAPEKKDMRWERGRRLAKLQMIRLPAAKRRCVAPICQSCRAARGTLSGLLAGAGATSGTARFLTREGIMGNAPEGSRGFKRCVCQREATVALLRFAKAGVARGGARYPVRCGGGAPSAVDGRQKPSIVQSQY